MKRKERSDGDTYKAEKKEEFAVVCGADVIQGRCWDVSWVSKPESDHRGCPSGKQHMQGLYWVIPMKREEPIRN